MLPAIPLHYALAICLVMVDSEPAAFPRYAVRWHGRFCSEAKGLTAEEAQLALAAVLSLMGPGRSAGVEALSELCEQRGFAHVCRVLEEWAGD